MKKLPFFKSLALFVVLLTVGSHLFGEEKMERQQTPAIAAATRAATGDPSMNARTPFEQTNPLRQKRAVQETSATRVFPWLTLSGDYDKELQLANASEKSNRSRVMVLTARELATWDVGLSERTISTTVPPDSSAIAIRSLRPSRAAVLWKRRDLVEWVDKGEEGPPVEVPPGSSVFLLELRAEGAVALQFELDGTDFQVHRSAQLRPAVSLLSRPDSGSQRTKVALVATDLQPLDSQFALLVTRNPEALPLILKALASDVEGNAVPVQVDFNLTTQHSE